MTQYELTIAPQNVEAHMDIEHDIQKQQNGLFTFIIRINNGNVVDYSVVEYADTSKYLSLTKITIQEFTIASYTVFRNPTDTLRSDNSQRETTERSGIVGHNQHSQEQTKEV